MRLFFANRWNKIGLGLVAIGWCPLCLIVLLAATGLWPDKNPNPIGPGLLFFLTFWPAIVCFAVGSFQVWRRRWGDTA